jgi:transaldolase
MKTAVKTAALMRDAGAADALIVLADDNASVPARERHAGRILREHGLSERQWGDVRRRRGLVARAVAERSGLRTVFHPHCGGYVETPLEIDALMRRTDPARLGLVLDTGHIVYGGGDPLRVLKEHRDRVWHVHFKDCDRRAANLAREQGLGYLAAVRSQLFCELGSGVVILAPSLTHCEARATAAGSSWSRTCFPVTARPKRARKRAATTCEGWDCERRSCSMIRRMSTGAAWKSPLHEMTQTTATCLWNDSADPDELRWSLEQGGVGATCNPVIAHSVLKTRLAEWRPRIAALMRERPAATEDDIAWAAVEALSIDAAALLLPAFATHRGRNGRLSIQTDPRLFQNAAAIVDQAARFDALAPNMIVKIPATRAGIEAIEEATARGISINATVSFTVPQCLAVAEAVERGLRRREAGGHDISNMGPVCTIMVGRLDDWLKVMMERAAITTDPGHLEWAGVAVFKKAYSLFRERGYRLRLLSAAFRNHMHWSELIGGDVVVSPPCAVAETLCGERHRDRVADRQGPSIPRSSTICIDVSRISGAPTIRTACESTSSTRSLRRAARCVSSSPRAASCRAWCATS